MRSLGCVRFSETENFSGLVTAQVIKTLPSIKYKRQMSSHSIGMKAHNTDFDYAEPGLLNNNGSDTSNLIGKI